MKSTTFRKLIIVALFSLVTICELTSCKPQSGCYKSRQFVGYGLVTHDKIDSVFAPDEQGYKSIWLTVNGKEYGMDALTDAEIDSVRNTLK